MAWARFDDNYTMNPKIIAAGPWAELLDVRGIIFCALNETDGIIAREVLARLGTGIPAPKAKAKRLVEVGRWLEHEDGWEVHNYLKYNPSHAKLEAERESARNRMSKARNSARSSPEHRENVDGSSGNPSRPVPNVNSSPPVLQEDCPQPVDEEQVSDRTVAVIDRIVDGRMARANGTVRNATAYRAKVYNEVVGAVGGLSRFRKIVDMHPKAPIEMLAAAGIGEPTPYLSEYRIDA